MASRVTPNVGAGRIMATDGGAHPPDLWAQVIVDDIVTLGPNLEPSREAAALRLRADLIDALTPHFTNAIDAEREKLSADAAHMLTPIEPHNNADAIVEAIIEKVKGSLWEDLFKDEDVVAKMKMIAMQHVGTAQHVERSWHADRNPDSEHAEAFRAMFHPGGMAAPTADDIAQAKAQNLANDAAPAG